MSSFVTVAADLLVAVLLVATIVTSVRLSRKVARMKADESAMRSAVAELVNATGSAERAIAGLRAAATNCERTLSERMEGADQRSAVLAGQIAAGESVLSRVERVASLSRGQPAVQALPAARNAAAPDDGLGWSVRAARDVAARATRRLDGRAA